MSEPCKDQHTNHEVDKSVCYLLAAPKYTVHVILYHVFSIDETDS